MLKRAWLKSLRVRFFKKIRDRILKSERIRKRILRFFTKQINPRSLGSWCVKGTEESILGVDSSVASGSRREGYTALFTQYCKELN